MFLLVWFAGISCWQIDVDTDVDVLLRVNLLAIALLLVLVPLVALLLFNKDHLALVDLWMLLDEPLEDLEAKVVLGQLTQPLYSWLQDGDQSLVLVVFSDLQALLEDVIAILIGDEVVPLLLIS